MLPFNHYYRIIYSVRLVTVLVCLSLRPLYVTVVYQGKYSHCMRIGVAVPLNSTVSRLREAVSRETKIPPDQVFIQKPADNMFLL